MVRSYEEDDYPSIGDVKDGYVLVCHGDDSPTEWISWLEDFVFDVKNFINLAEEYSIELKLDSKTQINSINDFLDLIGIELDGTSWTGSLISGVYYLGWLEEEKIPQSKIKAKKLLSQINAFISSRLRKAVLDDFNNIEDLQNFLDRTTQDPAPLVKTIQSQKNMLEDLQKELQVANEKIIEEKASVELYEGLLVLAGMIVNHSKSKFNLGPFVLWGDGNLYVLKTVGKTTLPVNFKFDLITQIARGSNLQVIEIHESTLIGGWTSGPIYRGLGNKINDWLDAWRYDGTSNRNFETNPTEFIDTVYMIAKEIGTHP